ncbi:MAG TPA: hypothetical protein VGS22_13710 [Thermoanaerobaculia bacterium]|jgi:hypothetical protein|nr:hypothetical protein [Thermoanaerobaculia bacterium]
MSEPIVRPVFFEGQILAAGDLEAAVEHARGEAARDRRSLHTPGIATGLALTGKDRTTASGEKFQEITLSAGIAVDRTGRQIVLAIDTRLEEQLFIDQGVQVKKDTEALYPVFLLGRDVQAPIEPTAACGTTGPTRVTESAEIEFGRPGSELEINNGEASEPADGVSDPSAPVLVGFVQWDGRLQKFKRAVLVSGGIGPGFAGALADEVVARNGALSLRSRRGVDKPALAIDESDDGTLLFGPQDSLGRVVPAFKVDAKGNVTARGKIVSSAAPGTVQVESGVITDGLVLPLPPGVKPEDVTAGKVVLHVHLTALPPGPTPLGKVPDAKFAVPLYCDLDSESRRVRCLNRWVRLTASGVTPSDLPGACNYTVLATAPARSEDQP